MQFRLGRHPSGKAQTNERWGHKSVWRVPDNGYVTPRLRRDGLVHAIGLNACISSDIDDAD